VQAGVINARLQAEVEKRGLFYPPDPSSLKQSAIGGNVAENAGGARCLKYGVTGDYVLALEVVLPDGTVIRTGGRTVKNVTGYDLRRLFTGAEGTLGTITEITLKLLAKPKFARAALAVYDRIEDAAHTATAVMASGILPSAIEIVDNLTMRCVETNNPIGLPLDADAILVAAGRTPNTAGLGLEAAGVAFTKKGVTVDANLRTSRPHIYAAGDVAGVWNFTHMADSQARTIVRNILLPWLPARAEASVVPWCTYTSPEVARVGLNEEQARRRKIPCDVITQPMKDVDRAVIEGEDAGWAKVLLAKGTDRILGVTLVAERAGDLLHEFVLAMKAGVGLATVAATVHAYPTLAEIAKKVADRQQKSRLTPFARRVLAWRYRRARSGA